MNGQTVVQLTAMVSAANHNNKTVIISPFPLSSIGWFIILDLMTSAGVAKAAPTNPANMLQNVCVETVS